MVQRTYFIDMDGTIAEWESEATWDEICKPGFFLRRKPMIEMIGAVKELIQNGHCVKILSAVMNDGCVADKRLWLDEYLPEIADCDRIFVAYGSTKSNSIAEPKQTDVLIDDYTINLLDWHGLGIKVLNGINHTNHTWQGASVKSNLSAHLIYEEILKHLTN